MKILHLKLLVLIMISIAGTGQAQQLTPFVISTSGGFYDNPAGMLSFTTGEMVAVETFSSPVSILTQGFQQVFDLETSIPRYPYDDFAFNVFPNPSTGYFEVYTDTKDNEQLTFTILDLTGRLMQQKNAQPQMKAFHQPFDLSGSAQGMYLVQLTIRDSTTGIEYNYFKKINIIR